LAAFLTILCVLLGGGTAFAQTQDNGGRLFIQKGCIGCHGVAGHGGAGPDLAGTSLPFEAFLAQLRTPRGQMPVFPGVAVSESEARDIYGYVKAATPPPRIGLKPPEGLQSPASCAECHRKLNPVLVAQYESSAMSRPGRENPRVPATTPKANTCAACHGTDHSEITRVRGRVSEKVCAACHPQIYQEAVTDAGHSYGPGPGNIGINWDRNVKVPHYSQMPRKVMEMGCDPCHAQAGATDTPFWDEQKKQYVDLSSLPYRNGCIACHTRHRFDPAEARRAEACMTCHMGPDHPNWEAYSTSKHGAIYLTDGGNWDWKAPMAQAHYNAPTCAYCHMLYVDPDGTRHTNHNMSKKIVWGMGIQPALGQLADITQRPENLAKRAEMLRVCFTCHSALKAHEYLEAADAHKLMGDALVIEGRDILHGLYRDKIIEPARRSRSAGLLPGDRFVATEAPGGTFWPAGLYYDVSTVEREYFDMFFFTNLKSYKGAFHMSPDYAWWYGYADTLGHLGNIRDEAGRLREAHRTARRTNFMLLTGPLMVLLVVGGVWGMRSLYRRRSGGSS